MSDEEKNDCICNSFDDSQPPCDGKLAMALQESPRINGKVIDLKSLFDIVEAMGGYKNVCKKRKWHIIADILLSTRCLNSSAALQRIYLKYIGNSYIIDDAFDRDDCQLIIQSRGSKAHSCASTTKTSSKASMSSLESISNVTASGFNKLFMSLLSGLPNEEELVLITSAVMSDENPGGFPLKKCPKFLDLLLSRVGVYPQDVGSQQDMYYFYECSNDVKGRNMNLFWESCLDPNSASLIKLLGFYLSSLDHDKKILNFDVDVSLEGDKAIAIALLLYSMSLSGENVKILAANVSVIKFLLLSVHSVWKNLKQIAYDILVNLASEINVPSQANILLIVLIETLMQGLKSSDKCAVVISMSILSRLCFGEYSEFIHIKDDPQAYECLISYLTINDSELMFGALEALNGLSHLGAFSCSSIVNVQGSINILLDLLTFKFDPYYHQLVIENHSLQKHYTNNSYPRKCFSELDLGTELTNFGIDAPNETKAEGIFDFPMLSEVNALENSNEDYIFNFSYLEQTETLDVGLSENDLPPYPQFGSNTPISSKNEILSHCPDENSQESGIKKIARIPESWKVLKIIRIPTCSLSNRSYFSNQNKKQPADEVKDVQIPIIKNLSCSKTEMLMLKQKPPRIVFPTFEKSVTHSLENGQRRLNKNKIWQTSLSNITHIEKEKVAVSSAKGNLISPAGKKKWNSTPAQFTQEQICPSTYVSKSEQSKALSITEINPPLPDKSTKPTDVSGNNRNVTSRLIDQNDCESTHSNNYSCETVGKEGYQETLGGEFPVLFEILSKDYENENISAKLKLEVNNHYNTFTESSPNSCKPLFETEKIDSTIAQHQEILDSSTNYILNLDTMSVVSSKKQCEKSLKLSKSFYMCKWRNCKLKFRKTTLILRHVTTKHGYKNNGVITCLWQECNKTLKNQKKFINHIKEFHCNINALKVTKKKENKFISSNYKFCQPNTVLNKLSVSNNKTEVNNQIKVLENIEVSKKFEVSVNYLNENIRFLSGCVLRNLAKYSLIARKTLRSHENLLLNLAITTDESAVAVSDLLSHL